MKENERHLVRMYSIPWEDKEYKRQHLERPESFVISSFVTMLNVWVFFWYQSNYLISFNGKEASWSRKEGMLNTRVYLEKL